VTGVDGDGRDIADCGPGRDFFDADPGDFVNVNTCEIRF
jgi:hypothetical protein